jgi:hypothetical protein
MFPGLPVPMVTVEEKASEEEEAFSTAVRFGTAEEIEIFLKVGHSPDYMKYPEGHPYWDTNPLWEVSHNYEKVKLFIAYGSDVNRRPYIGSFLSSWRILSERHPVKSYIGGYGINLEKDIFDLIKLYLDAGADPNIKYCPINSLFPPTEERYMRYFEENGDLPINDAIEDGLFSIVDLLLEYGAVLDHSSVERAKIATEKTGSIEMQEYIQKIWEQQNQERSP